LGSLAGAFVWDCLPWWFLWIVSRVLGHSSFCSCLGSLAGAFVWVLLWVVLGCLYAFFNNIFTYQKKKKSFTASQNATY
jgi:uncharacterized BrkB/YihY/UPF0761 family membrane protein